MFRSFPRLWSRSLNRGTLDNLWALQEFEYIDRHKRVVVSVERPVTAPPLNDDLATEHLPEFVMQNWRIFREIRNSAGKGQRIEIGGGLWRVVHETEEGNYVAKINGLNKLKKGSKQEGKRREDSIDRASDENVGGGPVAALGGPHKVTEIKRSKMQGYRIEGHKVVTLHDAIHRIPHISSSKWAYDDMLNLYTKCKAGSQGRTFPRLLDYVGILMLMTKRILDSSNYSGNSETRTERIDTVSKRGKMRKKTLMDPRFYPFFEELCDVVVSTPNDELLQQSRHETKMSPLFSLLKRMSVLEIHKCDFGPEGAVMKKLAEVLDTISNLKMTTEHSIDELSAITTFVRSYYTERNWYGYIQKHSHDLRQKPFVRSMVNHNMIKHLANQRAESSGDSPQYFRRRYCSTSEFIELLSALCAFNKRAAQNRYRNTFPDSNLGIMFEQDFDLLTPKDYLDATVLMVLKLESPEFVAHAFSGNSGSRFLEDKCMSAVVVQILEILAETGVWPLSFKDADFKHLASNPRSAHYVAESFARLGEVEALRKLDLVEQSKIESILNSDDTRMHIQLMWALVLAGFEKDFKSQLDQIWNNIMYQTSIEGGFDNLLEGDLMRLHLIRQFADTTEKGLNLDMGENEWWMFKATEVGASVANQSERKVQLGANRTGRFACASRDLEAWSESMESMIGCEAREHVKRGVGPEDMNGTKDPLGLFKCDVLVPEYKVAVDFLRSSSFVDLFDVQEGSAKFLNRRENGLHGAKKRVMERAGWVYVTVDVDSGGLDKKKDHELEMSWKQQTGKKLDEAFFIKRKQGFLSDGNGNI